MILLPATTIGSAGTVVSQVVDLGGKLPKLMSSVGKFLYGSGGTTVDLYVQTSFDNLSWADILNMHFTTAAVNKMWSIGQPASTQTASITDGALASDTGRVGFMGRFWRAKVISVGTYAGLTSIECDLFGSN